MYHESIAVLGLNGDRIRGRLPSYPTTGPCAMFYSLIAFSSYLFLIGPARAQVTAPNCTDSTYVWSYNSLKQNPCLVTAYLAAVCNNGVFAVPPLLPQHSYTGPSGVDNGDLCKCNTVVYNLISACDACQGESWSPYSVWTSNCTTKATPGTFPSPVPDGTRVPQWAFIDSSIGNNWNISAAQLVGDSPEVTGSPVPTSTSTSTSHHSSDTSVIVGATVGGVIGAALITGVAIWFVIRRHRARSVPSGPNMDFQGGEKEQAPPHPLAEGALRIYDPSDPSTYPSKEYLPVGNQPLGSTGSHPQPHTCGYNGLPEI